MEMDSFFTLKYFLRNEMKNFIISVSVLQKFILVLLLAPSAQKSMHPMAKFVSSSFAIVRPCSWKESLMDRYFLLRAKLAALLQLGLKFSTAFCSGVNSTFRTQRLTELLDTPRASAMRFKERPSFLKRIAFCRSAVFI